MEHSSDDQQQEEAWGGDLRSGVAQVFAESKRKAMLGIRVGAAWSLLLLLYAGLDYMGVVTVASVPWQVFGGLLGLLFTSMALSRTAVPLLIVSVLVIIDLVFISYRFSTLAETGTEADFVVAGLRVAAGPAVMYFVINGYLGLLSIEAFKNGFSPGQDWRTRVNPILMRVIIVVSCAAAVALGLGGWATAILDGFEQTGVSTAGSWMYNPFVTEEAPKVGRSGRRTVPVEDAKLDADGNVIDGGSEMVLPETVYPVDSLEGLDAYGKREAEDAYYFGELSTEEECLVEANGRQDRCRDDRCRYWARFFARACLVKAKPTEFFCDTVPKVRLVAAGITWAQGLCAGREFESCREMLYAVQGHCHPPDPILEPEAESDSDPDAAAEPE